MSTVHVLLIKWYDEGCEVQTTSISCTAKLIVDLSNKVLHL